MPIQGDVKNLYSDREKTRALFPTTKVSAVSDDNGVGLDALMENLLYSGSEVPEVSLAPLNADTLEGHPASDFATPSFVTSEIAKAQLSGGSGGDIDLSGFATKDDVNNAVRAIDYPVDSVNGKTGAVELSASDVGAAPSGYGLGSVGGADKWNGDANALTKQGWYRLESGTVNGIGASASVRVDGYSETGLTQTAYANSGLIKQRTCTDGTWSNWIDASPSAFAPSGYGLGDVCPVLGLSDATKTGWYKGAPGYVSGVPHAYYTDFWYCSHIEAGVYNGAIQRAYYNPIVYPNCEIVRTRNSDGTWSEWEWENPPMALGVEYRTTERCGGKVVYAKAISLGTLTSNDMSVSVGAGTIYTVRATGRMVLPSGSVRSLPCVDATYGAIGVQTNHQNVWVRGQNDITGGGAEVVVWYTKEAWA